MTEKLFAAFSCSTTKPPWRFRFFRRPGANALQLSKDVRQTMEELKKNFPEGVDYNMSCYDPDGVCVRHSIDGGNSHAAGSHLCW